MLLQLLAVGSSSFEAILLEVAEKQAQLSHCSTEVAFAKAEAGHFRRWVYVSKLFFYGVLAGYGCLRVFHLRDIAVGSVKAISTPLG